MKRVTDVLAILMATTLHIISGYVLIAIGRSHLRLYSELMHFEASSLSFTTNTAIAYTSTNAPITLGFLFGAITLFFLVFVIRSERFRWTFPILLAFSFCVATIPVIFVGYGVSDPFLRITYSMSEQPKKQNKSEQATPRKPSD